MHESTSEGASAWRSALRRGLQHSAVGDFGAAERAFERAYALAPERPEVCYALGRERLRGGRRQEAAELLDKAWRGDRSLVSAAATLARCIGIDMARPASGLRIVDDAIERVGNRAVLTVVRAEILLELGRFADARAAAEGALRTDGDSRSVAMAANMALARIENQEGIELASKGQHDRALFAFRAASRLDPEWSSPLCNTGAVFAKIDRPRRAESAYRAALARDPESVPALTNLGRLLDERGARRSARAHLERALALSPRDRVAAALLADISLQEGDAERARELLRTARASDPDGETPPNPAT